MTTPTQAQIEAAEIIRGLMQFADGHELQEPDRTILRQLKQRAATLTAAAQVDDHPSMVCPDCGVVHSWPSNQCSTCAVKLVPFAAAQVGEPELNQSDRQEVGKVLRAIVDERLATIERCAQVAENYGTKNHPIYTGGEIAAAIRELKDTP